MTEKQFPTIPQPLLDELNQRYPERSAELSWSDREIWIKAGERRVVRFLNEQFKHQGHKVPILGAGSQSIEIVEEQ